MKYRFLIFILLFTPSIFLLQKQAESQNFTAQSIIDSVVNSNTGLPTGVQEQITVEQIPRIPIPNQPVSIRVTSFLTNLNAAQITWTQDGNQLNSGRGVVSNTVTAPASGQSSVVRITITKEGGGTITQTISLNPADVDLIYEAYTYSHPFYKGKNIFSSESSVMFVAIPSFVGSQGQRIPDNELIYTWKINNAVQQNISGYGKNTFITKGALIERLSRITVDVSAPNSNLVATKTIQLKSQMPELVLYENNPLLGVVYEKAVQGSFLLERPQVDFEGVPYFFSAQTKDDFALRYKWSINGVPVQTKSQDENYMVLRNQKNEDGRAIIRAQLQHVDNLLQTNSVQIELNFKKINEINTNEEFVF